VADGNDREKEEEEEEGLSDASQRLQIQQEVMYCTATTNFVFIIINEQQQR